MVAHGLNPSTWEAEATDFGVRVQCGLQVNQQNSRSFLKPCLKKNKTIKSKQNAGAGETPRLTRAPTAFPEDPGLIPSLAAQCCLQLQFLGMLFVSDLHRDQVQTWCTYMQAKPTHA